MVSIVSLVVAASRGLILHTDQSSFGTPPVKWNRQHMRAEPRAIEATITRPAPNRISSRLPRNKRTAYAAKEYGAAGMCYPLALQYSLACPYLLSRLHPKDGTCMFFCVALGIDICRQCCTRHAVCALFDIRRRRDFLGRLGVVDAGARIRGLRVACAKGKGQREILLTPWRMAGCSWPRGSRSASEGEEDKGG